MEWLQNNLMVIIFYCFIIYMFGKISFQIYRTINKAKEGDMTNELPECTPLIAQYILNDGIINENAIKAVFLQLCKNNFIILNPVINEKDEIVDYELIKNNVPNFKEKDYEDNLFNEGFKDSNINLSYLYILNKYIFFGKEKNLYSLFIKEISNQNFEDDLLFIKIITAEMFNTNLIESKNENHSEIDVTKKGENVSENVSGLKLFLKKYNLISGFESDGINVWGDYLTYGITYGLDDLSIESLNILYAMNYFNESDAK